MPRPKNTSLQQKARDTVASNIFSLMKLQGISPKELSEITGIPATTLSGYIHGTSMPPENRLEKIAEALHVSKIDLDPRYKALYQGGSTDNIIVASAESYNDSDSYSIMAENIQYYLDRQGISRQKMSQDLGISYTTIATWLQAKSYPRVNRIEQMAEYFHISKSALMEKRTSGDAANSSKKGPVIKGFVDNIPIIGNVISSDRIDTKENIQGYRSAHFFNGKVPDGKLIAVCCQDDAMKPKMPKGTSAVVLLRAEIKSGDIAAVLLEGKKQKQIILRRISYDKDKLILWPMNINYDPIFLDKSQSVQILGKVIQYTAPL